MAFRTWPARAGSEAVEKSAGRHDDLDLAWLRAGERRMLIFAHGCGFVRHGPERILNFTRWIGSVDEDLRSISIASLPV